MGPKVPTLLKAQLDFKGREAHRGSVATTLQQRCNIVATTLQQRCKHSNYLMIWRYLFFGRQNLVVRGPKQNHPPLSGRENLSPGEWVAVGSHGFCPGVGRTCNGVGRTCNGVGRTCNAEERRRDGSRSGAGGSPEGGAARGADAPRAPPSGDPPAPLLPSPGLRSDPAQCNKRSPKVILTQAPESCPPIPPDSGAWVQRRLSWSLFR